MPTTVGRGDHHHRGDGSRRKPGSLSQARTVAVRYAVTAAGTTTPAAKKKVTITGTVKPGRADTVVMLQRLVGTTCTTLTTTKTTAKGGYTVSRSYAKGTWKLRVLVSGTAYNAEKVSRTLTVKAT